MKDSGRNPTGPLPPAVDARARRRHESPAHAQQVSQRVFVDAPEPDEDARIVDVVILEVERRWIGGNQLVAIGEIDPDGQ